MGSCIGGGDEGWERIHVGGRGDGGCGVSVVIFRGFRMFGAPRIVLENHSLFRTGRENITTSVKRWARLEVEATAPG